MVSISHDRPVLEQRLEARCRDPINPHLLTPECLFAWSSIFGLKSQIKRIIVVKWFKVTPRAVLPQTPSCFQLEALLLCTSSLNLLRSSHINPNSLRLQVTLQPLPPSLSPSARLFISTERNWDIRPVVRIDCHRPSLNLPCDTECATDVRCIESSYRWSTSIQLQAVRERRQEHTREAIRSVICQLYGFSFSLKRADAQYRPKYLFLEDL